jgi:hypothetical protein
MSRILLLTGYDEAFAWLGDKTTVGKRMYARRWGMGFRCADLLPEKMGHGHPSWQKLEHVLRGFEEGYRFVVWMDADTLVTNHGVAPPVMAGVLAASRDWGPAESLQFHFSLGAFCVAAEAMPLVERATFLAKTWMNSQPWDQGAVQQVVRENQAMERLVTILPGRALCAVPQVMGLEGNCNPWQKGDLLAHLTGSRERRELALAAEFAFAWRGL